MTGRLRFGYDLNGKAITSAVATIFCAFGDALAPVA